MKLCPKFCLLCTRACTRTQCDLSSSLCLSPARPIRRLSLLPLSWLSPSIAPFALADLIKGQTRDVKPYSPLCRLHLELEGRHNINQLPTDLISGTREATGLSNSSLHLFSQLQDLRRLTLLTVDKSLLTPFWLLSRVNCTVLEQECLSLPVNASIAHLGAHRYNWRALCSILEEFSEETK